MQRAGTHGAGMGPVAGTAARRPGGRDRLKALFTPSGGTEDPPPSTGDDGDYAALSRAYVELRRPRAPRPRAPGRAPRAPARGRRRARPPPGGARRPRRRARDRRRATETAEATLADRRRELGAVELRRAAVERREEVARTREIALEQRAEELAALARRLTDLGGSLVGVPEGQQEAPEHEHVVLEAGDGYRLHVRSGPHPRIGAIVELDDGARLCTAVTRSPFPLDARRCAVVERVAGRRLSRARRPAAPRRRTARSPPRRRARERRAGSPCGPLRPGGRG